MKKIKVAHFVGSMNCGGAETMLMNLFRTIDHEKYEFTFIVNINHKGWYDDEIRELGGRIIKVDTLSERSIVSYIKYLADLFRSEQFDIIHSHVFLHSGFVMAAAFKAGIKNRITHSHSAMGKNENNFIKRILLKYLILRYATQYVACSTEAGLCLFGKSFYKKGVVIRNPIDEQKIEQTLKNDKNKVIKELKITPKELILCHVGRFVPIKNHQFLLEIAVNLKEKKIPFKMILIGDGQLYKEIIDQVEKLQLKQEIIFTGAIRNVYEYLNCADFFLLPSFYEGLPLVGIEAQSLGKQCLFSNKISKESDMGIGLVQFLDINDINLWIERITNFKPNQVNGLDYLKESEYSIQYALKEIEKIYQ